MLSPISTSIYKPTGTSTPEQKFIGKISKLDYGNMEIMEFLEKRPDPDSADFSAYQNALHSGDTLVGKWLEKRFGDPYNLAVTEKDFSPLSQEQQNAVRTFLSKTPHDRNFTDILATGLITQESWNRCSSHQTDLLLSDQGVIDLLKNYSKGKFGQWMTVSDFTSLDKLADLLEHETQIAPALGGKLIHRISLLDTINDSKAFDRKLKVIRLLSERGARITDKHDPHSHLAHNDDGNTFVNAIIYAKNRGGYDYIERRLRSLSVNYMPAPDYFEHGLLKWIIKAGANVEPENKGEIQYISFHGASRLHYLAGLGTENVVDPAPLRSKYATEKIYQNVKDSVLEAMEAACEQGDDVNDVTQEGHPPLFFAALARSPGGGIVDFLLKRGACLDESVPVPLSDGKVMHVLPLTWAVMGGLRHEIFPGALKVLLEAGADPNKKDGDGFTVLDRLIRFPHADISLKMADYLLNQGAQLTSLDHDGEVSAWRKFVEEKGRSDLYERLTLLPAQGTSAAEQSSQPVPESVIKSDL